MERIAQAQALMDPERNQFAKFGRMLEINPRHPLVKELKDKWEEDKDSQALAEHAKTLYEVCLLNSGYLLDDPTSHTARVLQLLAGTMGVKDLAPLDEEEYIHAQEEDKKKDSMVMDGGESPAVGIDDTSDRSREEASGVKGDSDDGGREKASDRVVKDEL